MRFQPKNPLSTDIYADGTLAITLPGNIQNPGAMPWPAGFEFRILDNTGAFGSTCTVTGPINGSSSYALTTAYKPQSFYWVGGTVGFITG